MALVLEVLHSTPAAPSRLNPAVSTSLDAVTLRCLAKSLDTRYQSAVAVGDALREVARTPLGDALAPPPRDAVRLLLPRGAVRRGVVAIVLLAIAALAGAWFYGADVP